ncbi:nucleotidyl transferase AbiEii/AbiGii toxin family protein [Patescibacteria group bacterium]|nr:nucleotidyl transferase AbiEii/AbiGii toxin family protein [Patescibacteria group bacterium]
MSQFCEHGVLGGGTALALQIGHRKSYDFDVFLSKTLSKGFVYKVKKVFGNFELIAQTGDEFSFTAMPQNVKVSFIYYPYRNLYEKIKTPHLDIFSWKDIALDKAHTVGRRGEWRDYVDLYFIIRKGLSLSEIIELSKKKFGDSFSEKLFLSQLIYFEDIQDFTMELTADKPSRKDIKSFLEKEVKKLRFR